jgi:hypothetical protein
MNLNITKKNLVHSGKLYKDKENVPDAKLFTSRVECSKNLNHFSFDLQVKFVNFDQIYRKMYIGPVWIHETKL